MFSLFRFTITMCVTFSVVQAFCNSHPRWWPNRQQNLAKGNDAGGFLERMQRHHVLMKESSSSTDITSSPIAKGLESGNISAFLDFDGESKSISNTHRICEFTCSGWFPWPCYGVVLRPPDDIGQHCAVIIPSQGSCPRSCFDLFWLQKFPLIDSGKLTIVEYV